MGTIIREKDGENEQGDDKGRSGPFSDFTWSWHCAHSRRGPVSSSFSSLLDLFIL
jgi:hypothetical protein